MNFCEASQFLKQHDDYLILTHKNPDGDAVGSAAALCLMLRALGKTAYVYHNPGFTARFSQFLDGLTTEDTHGTVISVDLADASLVPQNAKDLAQKAEFAVDHHETHRAYAKNLLLDGRAAACGELVLKLSDELSVSLTREIARALYLAIVTDTGSFCYSNTTAETHLAVARLLPLFDDAHEINHTFCVEKSRARATLEARLLTNANFYFDGKCVALTVTRALMAELGLCEDDLDNLASVARAIQGVSLALVLRELENGDTKASLRSNPDVDASAICQVFHGGGHRCAAGCTLALPYPQAEEKLIQTITEFGVFQ